MSARVIHLVYPHGPRISCPDAIGRNLGRRLERHYTVRYAEYHGSERLQPGPDDVLLGHANPIPFTTFRRSLRNQAWQRVLQLSPFNGDPYATAFLDSLLPHCDLFLAICGPYWFRQLESSVFAHWIPKMRHLDLAVDRADYPPVKRVFHPPGRRRWLYIGNTTVWKNTGYLDQIAAALPGIAFGWIGAGRSKPRHLEAHGHMDFSSPAARALVASYDFLITVGWADANPSTILEAMAWGLIPVCTPQSGYEGNPGIVNVPLNNASEAIRMVRELQDRPENELRVLQEANWRQLDEHFNWDRFAAQVRAAIESDEAPPLGPEPAGRRWRMRWAEGCSPHAVYRPRTVKQMLKRVLSNLRRGAPSAGGR